MTIRRIGAGARRLIGLRGVCAAKGTATVSAPRWPLSERAFVAWGPPSASNAPDNGLGVGPLLRRRLLPGRRLAVSLAGLVAVESYLATFDVLQLRAAHAQHGGMPPPGSKVDESRRQSMSEVARRLIDRLRHGQSMAALMTPSIDVVYHIDSRCDGSTDGQVFDLPAEQIDTRFPIRVSHDGEAWGCEPSPPRQSVVIFDLRHLLATWDRMELVLESSDPNAVLIEGKGQSDYLVLHFGDQGRLITKLEYRSEDPG